MIKLTKILSELFEQTPDSRGGEDQKGDPGVYDVGSSADPSKLSGPASRGETQVTKKDAKGNLILPSYKPGGLTGQTFWYSAAKYRDKNWGAPGTGYYFQTPIKGALYNGKQIFAWNDKTPTFNKKMLNQMYLGIDINEYKSKGGTLRGLDSGPETRGTTAENTQTLNAQYNLGDVQVWRGAGKRLLPAYRGIYNQLVPRGWPYTKLYTIDFYNKPDVATVQYGGVGNIGTTSRSIMNAYMGEESMGKSLSGFTIIEDPAGDAAIQNVLAGKDPLGRDFSRKNKNTDQQQHWATIKQIIEKGVAM